MWKDNWSAIDCSGMQLIAFSMLTFPIGYALRRRSLRFREFSTINTAAENFHRVLNLVEKEEWVVRSMKRDSYVIAQVIGFPKTIRSWGEQVSIRFHGSHVQVNSIGDPSGRFSVTTLGRNRENVEAVRSALGGV
jgi:hypothetical protein